MQADAGAASLAAAPQLTMPVTHETWLAELQKAVGSNACHGALLATAES